MEWEFTDYRYRKDSINKIMRVVCFRCDNYDNYLIQHILSIAIGSEINTLFILLTCYKNIVTDHW